MLTIKCAACRKKLWTYTKLGQGDVLRCHKDRINKIYQMNQQGDKIYCKCGKPVGIDKGPYIKMVKKAFTYAGDKINR